MSLDPYAKVLSSSLDLFSTPYLDLSSENTYTAEFSLTVPLQNNSETDIQFQLGTSTDFTDLSRSNIIIETHIETADGERIPGNYQK